MANTRTPPAPTKRRFHSAPLRLFTAGVALPAVLALVWVPRLEIGFAIFIGVLAAVGLYEYYAIVRSRQISPETIGGILSGALVALSGYFHNLPLTNLLLYGGCLMVSALHIVRGQRSVAGLSSSVFGVFYVGWFGAHITLVHGGSLAGRGLVTLLLVVVAFTDTAAYVFGSLFGRHKMAPRISPNKSWEGAVAGFLAALGGAAAVWGIRAHWGTFALPDWSLARYIHVGAVLSIASQVGDLMESCLKRDAGVKDSGVFFPGHGGVLDRCDGFLFAAPILYYVAMPLVGK